MIRVGLPILLTVVALAIPSSAAAARDLQADIDAAPVGGTVLVPADTYDQTVVITKDLRLQGEGAGSRIAPSTPGLDALIRVEGPVEVTISALRLDMGTAAGGVRARTGARVAVDGVTIVGDSATQQNGVAFESGAGGVVRASTVSNVRCAACAADPSLDAGTAGGAAVLADRSAATGVTVVGSTLAGNRYGVRAVAAPRVDVLSSTITGVAGTGVGVGVLDCDATCGGTAQATQGVIHGSTITGLAHGVLVGDLVSDDGLVPAPAVGASRVVDNGTGITSDVPLQARSVWWGCNAGTGAAGCDTVAGAGAITTTPHLVLRLLSSASSIPTGGATAQLTADLSRDSSGAATGAAFPDGTAIAFGSARGSVAPSTAPTRSGAAAAVLTSGVDPGDGAPTATLDGETVGVPVAFTSPPPTAVTAPEAVAPAPPPAPAPSAPTPAPTTGAERLAAARKVIGSKVVRLQKAPAPGVIYVDRAIRTGRGTLTVPDAAIVSLMVLACPETACDAGVSARVTRASRRKAQKLRAFSLRRAEFSLAAGRQRLVAVRLTKAQRDGIRRARRATMRVVIAVSDPAGRRQKRTLSVTLKIRPPAKTRR
ncbi:hypothetical protein [Paraconexibacter sp.]|uniref:hypothetical protein n=1 Tax=Paraconexibacter sp. TaxID=2949640 RepID=UPI00356757D5